MKEIETRNKNPAFQCKHIQACVRIKCKLSPDLFDAAMFSDLSANDVEAIKKLVRDAQFIKKPIGPLSLFRF